MDKTNEENVFWYSLKKPAEGKKLSGTIEADIVVVGGGMAGLSCAQKLREHNLSVVLLEKDFCGAGASGKTSGFITPDSEIELSALLANYGPEKAKRIWEFVISGVSAIKKNIEMHSIDCDYRVQDSMFMANNKSGLKYVSREHEARKALGYESRLYSKDELSKVIGSSGYFGAVRYPDTFGINSYFYCQAMREVLIKKGVQIFEDTPAINITNSGVGTPIGRVEAKHVIVAGDRFIPDMGILKKEIYHVQTFLGISKPLSDENTRKIFSGDKMMAWDTDLIYNYFRVTGGNRVLLGGGDLLYTYARSISDNTKRFKKRLSHYFHKKFPHVPFELEYIWPGMLGVSKDLLPVMGNGPDNNTDRVWYFGAATGLPWAAALGRYAADKIVNGRSEFDDSFSWRRKFVISSKVQAIITTPVTYAISHGIAKHS